MNGHASRIQAFASSGLLPSEHNEQMQGKSHSMGLFKPDLYRSFFFGFGVTALVLAVKIVPQLV
jgi:hypothetical protein